MNKYNIAVVGATGNVGREILNCLSSRNFPIEKIYALASRSSMGSEVSFGEKDIVKVDAVEDFDFSLVDFAFFAAGSELSNLLAKKAAEEGAIVIDNSSLFRMEKNVPLIVPEVNISDLFGHQNIIANPNCSTIQMVVALNPLHDEFGIKRIVVSTYQSVSGAGREAMDELYNQTKGVFMNDIPQSKIFSKRIAFNVIPHIDEFMDDGSTKEEWKMINETKKIMGNDIEVIAHCVRVPVFVGHSESITVEFEDPCDIEHAKSILENAPGVTIFDRREIGGYITPAEIAQEDNVIISRIRKDNSVKSGLAMWVVADNLRKGGALNAVQIAEEIIKDPFRLMNTKINKNIEVN